MTSKQQASDPGRWMSPVNKPLSIETSDSSLDGFGDLYREHVVAIYRYHHARTGSVSDAQDLTSETFRAALESFSRYRTSKGRPIAWLMGIARHKLADYFRRAPQNIPLEFVEKAVVAQPSPEIAVGQRLVLDQVVQAMHRINQARAEALILHLYVGLSLEETGQVMHKNRPAVKKLVQRGLADLRRYLNSEKVE